MNKKTQTFLLGDEVYHASNPKMIMVVVEVNGDDILCGWTDKESGKKKSDEFSSFELRKDDKRPLITYRTQLP